MWHRDVYMLNSISPVSLYDVLCHSQFSVGTDEARLWKRHAVRHPIGPDRPSPGGHEGSGSTCLSVKSLWSRHPSASSPALAPCTWTNFVQASSSGLLVHSWTWAGLLDRHPTASCWNTRPTTPTVIVNLGFGCTSDTASYCRRPVVSCRGSTNMEQFTSWSDVVNFPFNL